YVDSHAWIGTKYGLDSKIKRDGIDYRALARRGEVTISRLDSGIINYDDVFDYIVDLVNHYDFNVKQIAYDPYQSAALIAKLDQAGYP
ncbi:terminase large subunit, partial [Limosilactobacillus mucosae]|nr:terminase large subunit [Limosilactobacillus mucosae]